jgi:hypothetical protein
MITVQRVWLAKDGNRGDAIDNAKEYRERFDPSSSFRIYTPESEPFRIFIEEDYESLAESEEKWAERHASSEFGSWIKEWRRVAVENTLAFNYLERH